MERGSTKHGPNQDEQMAEEVRGTVAETWAAAGHTDEGQRW